MCTTSQSGVSAFTPTLWAWLLGLLRQPCWICWLSSSMFAGLSVITLTDSWKLTLFTARSLGKASLTSSAVRHVFCVGKQTTCASEALQPPPPQKKSLMISLETTIQGQKQHSNPLNEQINFWLLSLAPLRKHTQTNTHTLLVCGSICIAAVKCLILCYPIVLWLGLTTRGNQITCHYLSSLQKQAFLHFGIQ